MTAFAYTKLRRRVPLGVVPQARCQRSRAPYRDGITSQTPAAAYPVSFPDAVRTQHQSRICPATATGHSASELFNVHGVVADSDLGFCYPFVVHQVPSHGVTVHNHGVSQSIAEAKAALHQSTRQIAMPALAGNDGGCTGEFRDRHRKDVQRRIERVNHLDAMLADVAR